ncbi:hypothetical protein [Nitrosomonas aestuarii]|uniref:hypothetical protein n=1 Tax=Nitrosomonas aestuarii TaxID=52441 RepID=UPI0015E6FA02|nr:hypothetical protein [Nitrosomonas aestuarii]
MTIGLKIDRALTQYATSTLVMLKFKAIILLSHETLPHSGQAISKTIIAMPLQLGYHRAYLLIGAKEPEVIMTSKPYTSSYSRLMILYRFCCQLSDFQKTFRLIESKKFNNAIGLRLSTYLDENQAQNNTTLFNF